MKAKFQQTIEKKSVVKFALLAAFVILVIYCSFSLIKNTADISRLNAQAAEYNAQYEQQINENEKIKAILESDNKDEYIEQKAREKGYVKDGEIVFYNIS